MRIGVFLAVSLVFMLSYAGFNFWATSVAEEAIAQAPTVPASTGGAVRSAACERASEYYDQLLERDPAGGNFELRENQLDAAQAEINRSCPAD